MKASSILFLVVITIVGLFSATSQAVEENGLNVTIRGLDQAETYIIGSTLKAYKLPLSTPVMIEKGVLTADWNGQPKNFNAVMVTIKTSDGEFVGNVDSRNYPQIPGAEYYGLLQLALGHACTGQENSRRDAEMNKKFDQIREEVTAKASQHNYRLVFPEKRQGTMVRFRINNTLCEADFSGESLKYSMVYTDNVMRPVRDLDKIFQIVPNI